MIDLYFKDGWDIKKIAKKFNVDYSHIKELISLYSFHGLDAIKLKSKYVCYRRKTFGELLQIDASIYPRFKDSNLKYALHEAMDDATGTIKGV